MHPRANASWSRLSAAESASALSPSPVWLAARAGSATYDTLSAGHGPRSGTSRLASGNVLLGSGGVSDIRDNGDAYVALHAAAVSHFTSVGCRPKALLTEGVDHRSFHLDSPSRKGKCPFTLTEDRHGVDQIHPRMFDCYLSYSVYLYKHRLHFYLSLHRLLNKTSFKNDRRIDDLESR